MEVTNTNTNQFAPKLGQTAPDIFSSDAFSTHLAETDTYASDQADARADDRKADIDDRRADERQADAEKADAAAEEERRADERDQDTDDANADTLDEQDTAGDNPAPDVNLADAEPVDPLKEEGPIAQDDEIVGNAEDGAEDGTIGDPLDGELTAGPTEDISETIAPTDTAPDAQNAGSQTAATDVDEITDAATSLEDTDTLTADELALQTAQSSNNSATAYADATAGSAAQQAARPAPNATIQTAQQAAQAAAGADNQSSSLPNPLEAGLQSDVDSGADGKRGLGYQAAEAMAGKAKSSATNTQTPSAPQVVPAAAPAAAVTPLQAMAAAGLNLSSLPTDLDLLNLNAPNQVSPTGTPQNSNPVLVRFGALPGQAQATQVPNTAIALQISKHVARGVSTFEIRLDPAEMGRIDVKLELAKDGRVTAHLAVEKAETLDLLQKDAKALEQALKDAGLDADSDTLNFSLKSGSENADGNETKTLASDKDQLGGEEEGEDILLNAVAARQIEAAARGGIDVSI